MLTPPPAHPMTHPHAEPANWPALQRNRVSAYLAHCSVCGATTHHNMFVASETNPHVEEGRCATCDTLSWTSRPEWSARPRAASWAMFNGAPPPDTLPSAARDYYVLLGWSSPIDLVLLSTSEDLEAQLALLSACAAMAPTGHFVLVLAGQLPDWKGRAIIDTRGGVWRAVLSATERSFDVP